MAMPPMPPPPTGGDSSPNPIDNPFIKCAIAAVCWCAYDLLLCFPREVRDIWRARWSVSKVLYIFVRYHSLGLLIFYMHTASLKHDFELPADAPPEMLIPCIMDHPRALKLRWYVAMSEICTILAGEAMVLVRLNALYGWDRWLIIATIALFVVEGAVGFTTSIITLLGGSSKLLLSTHVLDCTATARNIPDVNVGMWICSLAVSFIYFSLIINRALVFSLNDPNNTGKERGFRRIFNLFKRTGISPTVHVCLRDGAIYFVVIFVALFSNLILTASQPKYAQLGTPWLVSTYSIASSRIFLNLKALMRKRSSVHVGSTSFNEYNPASISVTSKVYQPYRHGDSMASTPISPVSPVVPPWERSPNGDVQSAPPWHEVEARERGTRF